MKVNPNVVINLNQNMDVYHFDFDSGRYYVVYIMVT